MMMRLVISATLIAAPAYAGMCGENEGVVRCTDDSGRNSTLQTLDKGMVDGIGPAGPSGQSLLSNDMATYPRNTQMDDLMKKPAEPPPRPVEEEVDPTFYKLGSKSK